MKLLVFYSGSVLGALIGFMTAALLQAGHDEPENREEEERE